MTNVAEVKPPSSTPPFCAKCGGKLFGAVVFCPYCGNQMPSTEGQKAAAADKAAGIAAAKESAREAEAPAVKKPDPVAPPVKVAEPVKEAVKPKPVTPAAPPPPPKPAPTPAPTPTPPVSTPPPAPPAPGGDTKSGGGGKRWLITLLVAGAAGWWFFGRDKGPDACDKALAEVQFAIAAGQVEDARVQSRAAGMVCTDNTRAKKAKDAEQSVQAMVKIQARQQADKDRQDRHAMKDKADCDRRFNQAKQLLTDRRPASASKATSAISSNCVELLNGQVASLTVEIQAQAMRADQLVQAADAAILAGNVALAAQKVEQLAGEDRDHAQLVNLRARVARLSAQSSAPAVVTPPPAPVPAPARPAPTPAPRPAPAQAPLPWPIQQPAPAPAPAAQQDNAQRDMANAFLRDAESSMQRHLYDEAKTYVKSAERMDPRNPDVARMKQRITQHELEYMRKAIVIQ